jgi:hypothetical protein
MKKPSDAVRLLSEAESVEPVTILDGEGHVVRVVSAEEFRRTHPTAATPRPANHRWRRSTGRRPDDTADADHAA